MITFVKPDICNMHALFKALSDPTRLRILNLLCDGEICVCHIADALRLVQPRISRHLAFLKRAGVVKARREGKWMHYAWAQQTHPAARNVMDGLCEWMAKDSTMTRERLKLKKICCK